jgi:hypothetical protein
MNNIKNFVFGIKNNIDGYVVFDAVTGEQQDRLTIKELEEIFDGNLPDEAFEFLLKPTLGRPVYVTRSILKAIADGSYPDLFTVDGWKVHDVKIEEKTEISEPIILQNADANN